MDISPDVVTLLLAKTWFGFDLDDTLHEFRKASANASRSVCEAILEAQTAQPGTNTKKTTANVFTDGRTSGDYRRERFFHLLETHSIQHIGAIGPAVGGVPGQSAQSTGIESWCASGPGDT
ncbi:hypothetical protein BDW68DRAFT_172965 [Aspergillus falconensis]